MTHPPDPTKIACDSGPFLRAMRSLTELAESRRELVEGFLRGLDATSELVRVDFDERAAPSAGEVRVVLKPSDRFIDFLTAAGAGDVQAVGV